MNIKQKTEDKRILSIIIPTYNRAQALCRCLDSILIFLQYNCEIIVVDDASTDETNVVCKKYCESYLNIDYVYCEQNKGPGFARNIGKKIAIGEWIMFVDSDDTLDTTAFALLLGLLESKINTECVVFNAKFVYDNGDNSSVRKYTSAIGLCEGGALAQCPLWAFAFKSEIIAEIDFINTYAHEDTLFTAQVLAKINSIYCFKEFVYIRYISQDTLTSSVNSQIIDNSYKAMLTTYSMMLKSHNNRERQLASYSLAFCLLMDMRFYSIGIVSEFLTAVLAEIELLELKEKNIILTPATKYTQALAKFLQSSGYRCGEFIDQNATEYRKAQFNANSLQLSSFNEFCYSEDKTVLVFGAFNFLCEEVCVRLDEYGLKRDINYICIYDLIRNSNFWGFIK